MFGGNAGRENILVVIQQFAGDFQNLLRRFSCAENNFGKAFAKGAMRIDLRETKVGNGRSLKGLQHFVPIDTAGTKFFQKLNCFGNCHAPTMPQKSPPVTRENGASDKSSSKSSMLEQPTAVLEEIPDDENVQAKNYAHLPVKTGVHKFTAFH